MSTHTLHEKYYTFYFITFTCHQWLPLLEESGIYDFFPGWFRQLHKRHLSINAYCIMPNHIHLICYADSKCQSINMVIGEAKRFLAYEIVKRLRRLKKHSLIQKMKEGVAMNEKLKGKKHQVFKLSFDAKEVSPDRIEVVMDYIHNNPIAGKWQLAEDYTDYPYSSASYYDLGSNKPDFITDYRDIIQSIQKCK